MRLLPRIRIPRLRFRREKLRRWVRSVSVASFLLASETFAYALLLVFLSTGKRAAFLKNIHDHADVFLSLLLLAGFAAFHRFALRRIVPRIEQHFFPKPYEERQVLSGLGQEARTASSIEQLYLAIACRIAESFEAENVAVLVRDKLGDYVCAASSSPKIKIPTPLKLRRESFIVRRLNHLSTPLIIEPSEIETWNHSLTNAPESLRAARAQEHDSLLRLKSHLLIQIRTRDQMVGILSLSLRRGQFRYGPADRETLTALGEQLALVIENSRLAQRMVIQERLNRELALAAEVQKRLLPLQVPDYFTIELSGFCEPARGVGGDYYDFISVDKDRVGIAIADVAGKGMPAALLMSTVQATLRSLTANSNGSALSAEASLGKMVSKLNRLIFNSTYGQHYVTFFYAHFDQTNRRLTYVNAGHNPPLYLRSNGNKRFRRLTAGGLIAGAFEDCKYDQETFQMQSDDLLFLYTDGLTEAMNPEGEEFGELRVEEMLTAFAHLPAQEIRNQIAARVKEWCSGAGLYDDLTFVVMKVN
ncbi:MAG TPA: GAF domain-containing SpoIIE family protein phosphatase [Pyrinomonadaceae bacterium]